LVRVLTVGTFTVDIVASDLPKVADPGEIVNVSTPIDLHVGGHAANVAIDLVKLGVKGEVYACGAVGDDVFARIIRDELSKYGIRFLPLIISEVGTARNAILVVSGEDRRFHIYPGANKYLRPNHVLDTLKEVRPNYMYLAIGFSKYLDSELGTILREASRLGTKVLLDIARMSEHAIRAVKEVLGSTDFIHMNYLELSRLVGESDLVRCARRISEYPKVLLAVTYGEGGVKALFRGSYIISQPSFKVGSKDPTGAGDAFSAGIISYLINYLGSDFSRLSTEVTVKLLMYAQAAGASATLSPGATTSVSSEVVESLIESQGNYVLSSTKVYDLEGKVISYFSYH